MFRLRNWHLCRCYDAVAAFGDCYGNERFLDGYFVHTSAIQRQEVENDQKHLKLFTRSGSCYVLEFADLDENGVRSTKEALHLLGIALDIKACLALRRKREEQTSKQVSGVLEPDSLYVKMAGGYAVREAYFKTREGAVVPVPVRVHIGSFSPDSILVKRAGLCDWRIFPDGFSVKPYHWSDGLESVCIENLGSDFIFEASKRKILCRQGEVTVIKSEDYTGEGLFSPDAVNGKCVFFREEDLFQERDIFQEED